jgi:hypothetical protein
MGETARAIVRQPAVLQPAVIDVTLATVRATMMHAECLANLTSFVGPDDAREFVDEDATFA